MNREIEFEVTDVELKDSYDITDGTPERFYDSLEEIEVEESEWDIVDNEKYVDIGLKLWDYKQTILLGIIENVYTHVVDDEGNVIKVDTDIIVENEIKDYKDKLLEKYGQAFIDNLKEIVNQYIYNKTSENADGCLNAINLDDKDKAELAKAMTNIHEFDTFSTSDKQEKIAYNFALSAIEQGKLQLNDYKNHLKSKLVLKGKVNNTKVNISIVNMDTDYMSEISSFDEEGDSLISELLNKSDELSKVEYKDNSMSVKYTSLNDILLEGLDDCDRYDMEREYELGSSQFGDVLNLISSKVSTVAVNEGDEGYSSLLDKDGFDVIDANIGVCFDHLVNAGPVSIKKMNKILKARDEGKIIEVILDNELRFIGLGVNNDTKYNAIGFARGLDCEDLNGLSDFVYILRKVVESLCNK